MDIQHLLDTHEQYKSKWLQQNEEGLFNRIVLWENILDARTHYRSKYQEDKQQTEIEKGIRRIELKTETDDWGKKKHTEATADATITQEFEQKDKYLSLTKLIIERLENKVAVISEYINIIKLYIKK